MRVVLSAVLLALALACGGEGGRATGPAGPVVATLTLSDPGGALQVGASLTLVADIRDASGAAITAKTPTWTTSNPAAATVANGVVKGVAPGNAIITVTVDGKSAGTQVTVILPPVVAVAITPLATSPVVAGTTTPLEVVLKAGDGTVLSGRPITFSSSAPLVATVNGVGQLVASSPGTTTITATSGGVSGTLSVVVVAPEGSVAPTIASISPASLSPGTTATITGSGFLAPASNAVTIASVAAAVVAATPTSLTFVVPPTGLPCQSAQNAPVTVATVGGMATVSHPLVVATPRALAVGESFVTDASGSIACNELPAGGSYLITVFNGATSPTITARFDLRGVAGGSLASRIPVSQPAAAVAPIPIPIGAPTGASTSHSEHLSRLDDDRALLERLGAPRRPVRGPSFSRSSSVPLPLTVGSTTTLNYHYANCTAAGTTSITARVVYIGAHAVVLEDVAGPLAGTLDSDLVALADQFERVSYPLLLNFGDPLAYDSKTDGNGHIVILFTPRVNSQSANLLGFVTSCDLYPGQTDPSVAGSNEGEIFYARTVTDTSSTSTSLNGRTEWLRQMPATMIHEAKHIISYAERLSRGATVFEQTWLEEGTAQIASELLGRALHGNGWRGDAGYTPSLSCEALPTTAGCAGALVMTNHFTFLSNYLRSFQSKSVLSGAEDSDIYGSGWLFARWLTDTYGGTNEGAFLRSIVQASTLTGAANVEAATGKTFPQLLAQFSLMVAADDLPNVTGPYVEPSWNLPDVLLGLTESGSQPPVPLAWRQDAGGSFAVSSRGLKGGGAALVRLDAGGTQLLDLRAAGSTPLTSASPIGLAVLRIQ
ncbi:MAG TPA: Ig-like domain-containing protein [Gemmatimonadaceae bacterium]